MKIQKRDGRVVPYEEDKIREAIHKANNEVEERYRASEGLIEEILEDVQQASASIPTTNATPGCPKTPGSSSRWWAGRCP